MSALPGLYTELIHDDPNLHVFMREFRPKAIMVMDPSAGKVAKIWATVQDWSPYLILRKWEWDDGRTEQNPQGVYAQLWADPSTLGRQHAVQWHDFVGAMRVDAQRQGLILPPDELLICHLVNEPDTNGSDKQVAIDRYTETAVREAYRLNLLRPERITLGCFNLGEGHPAELKDGQPDWSPFAASLKVVRDYGMWVFLHEYTNSQGLTSPQIFPWHIGRHTLTEALDRQRLAITEWGWEQLVNGVESEHHGWIGRTDPETFAQDYLTYCTRIVAPEVQFVCIFADDLADRIWNSFAALPAKEPLVQVSKILWEQHSEKPPEPDIDDGPDLPAPIHRLVWPVRGQITQRFGENYESHMQRYGCAGHNGLDIAAPEGTPVVAMADGDVAWVGEDPDYGIYVRLYHPQLKIHSFYAHLQAATVEVGQVVRQGQAIGLVGSTGNSTGPHLHVEIRLGKANAYTQGAYGHSKGRVDPETVLYLL